MNAVEQLINHYTSKIRMISKDRERVGYIMTRELLDKEINRLNEKIVDLKSDAQEMSK